MREIDVEEIKKIQMDVLQVVHQFCKDNDIIYSLACGTILGAIRHKGYIPWDDDIDIYLLRKDYNKLIESFPKELSFIKLTSLERDSTWDRAYSKAYDRRTIIIEKMTLKEDIGVNIDIYPIDDVPDVERKWILYNKKRRFLQNIFIMKSMSFSKKRGIKKNIIAYISKILLFPFSARWISKLINNYAQIYNNNNFNRCFECVQGMLQKKPFPKELMKETIPVKFEERIFMVMSNYDCYLTNAYGDYMKFPPMEKRISHHDYKAFWKDEQ